MVDTEPLMFRARLGALRPVTAAAEDALRAVGDNIVRVEIKATRGNTRRLSWYWVMLKLSLDNLDDAFDGVMTTRMLHRWLKREAGLAKPVRSKKTGEIIDYDYDSISFAKMPENERAEYIDFVSDLLAKRLGIDTATLRNEAQAQV